jgi:hypothetical protein
MNLSEAFKKELESSGTEIAVQYAEYGLDLLIEDDVIKDIPFISTVVSLYKIGKTISDRHHIKQLCIFLNEIGYGISGDKREKYINDFVNKKDKDKEKELEYVVIILAQYLGEDKPRWLAKLYLAFLTNEIEWREFAAYSEIINRFLPGDIEALKQEEWSQVKDEEVPDALIRMSSYGVYTAISRPVTTENYPGTIMIPASDKKDYRITLFGRKLMYILLSS